MADKISIEITPEMLTKVIEAVKETAKQCFQEAVVEVVTEQAVAALEDIVRKMLDEYKQEQAKNITIAPTASGSIGAYATYYYVTCPDCGLSYPTYTTHRCLNRCSKCGEVIPVGAMHTCFYTSYTFGYKAITNPLGTTLVPTGPTTCKKCHSTLDSTFRNKCVNYLCEEYLKEQ